jgi:hypothetical protein
MKTRARDRIVTVVPGYISTLSYEWRMRMPSLSVERTHLIGAK